MMKPLRKKHLLIWTCWALLVPAGILRAWYVIPDQPSVKLIRENPVQPLPEIAQSQENAQRLLRLRRSTGEDSNRRWQLEWQNKMPLTVPSAIIYRETGLKDSSGLEWVGRIEGTGSYNFPVMHISPDTRELRFMVYDFIHQVMLEKIVFRL